MEENNSEKLAGLFETMFMYKQVTLIHCMKCNHKYIRMLVSSSDIAFVSIDGKFAERYIDVNEKCVINICDCNEPLEITVYDKDGTCLFDSNNFKPW